MAHLLDASIAGSITAVLGFIFLLVYWFAPNKGIIAVLYRKRQQRIEVSLLTFLLHLNNHQEESERHINHLNEHINWQKVRSEAVVKLALENNMITVEDQLVSLTDKGKEFTDLALEYIITNKDEHIEHLKKDFFLFRG